MNNKLKEKQEIIKKIFRKDILIDELKIDIKIEDQIKYVFEYFGKDADVDFVKEKVNADWFKVIKSANNANSRVVLSIIEGDRSILNSVHITTEDKMNEIYYPLKRVLTQNSLFMPASRTGLMMLYKEYFAHKADNVLNYFADKNGRIQQEIAYGDITKPMYEFLRFLQMYDYENESEYYLDELKFFDRNIIEGHIIFNKQGRFAYKQGDNDNNIPMYLASSMINEVAPIALALNSREYDQLIIDEVEASLHPEKQQELARLLVRLSNKENVNDYLGQLGFDKNDLMNTDNIYVYSFETNENGKCSVKEIKPDKDYGYQFDLFMNSNLKLYKETSILEDGGNK